MAKKWTQDEDNKMLDIVRENLTEGKTSTEAIQAASKAVNRSISSCNSRLKRIKTQQQTLFGVVMNVQMQNLELARELSMVKQQLAIMSSEPEVEKRKIGFAIY